MVWQCSKSKDHEREQAVVRLPDGSCLCVECDWGVILDGGPDRFGAESLCIASTRSGRRCRATAHGFDEYCRTHQDADARSYVRFMREWALFINDHLDRQLVRMSNTLGDQQLVYFARCGESIKIGISLNPESRIRDLSRPGDSTARPRHMPLDAQLDMELLKVVGGGRRVEARIHDRFRDLRCVSRGGGLCEWFRATPELLAYIDSLQPKS